jgi:membrane associated rhomboid family serine protease
MFAAPLKLSPVRTNAGGLRRLRWRLPREQSRRAVEIDSGTLRIPGLAPIPLRRVQAVAHYAKGIGAGVEICVDAAARDDLSRLRIPARAFGSFDDADRIVALIEEAIAARGGQDERHVREMRALSRERASRIPWLSFWFAGACLALTVVSHFTAGGDFVLASIAHGSVVPDMVRAGEYHRLLTAGLVHGSWVHAIPMILGWCLMIAIEKRAGTALVAGGFVGGGVAGYLSVVGPGGAWQAYGASTAFVGMVGAVSATMVVDPERLDAPAVRAEIARPIRAAGILLLTLAFAVTSIETRLFWPVDFCALFGGAIIGLLLCVASRNGGLPDKLVRNVLIALCMGAIGWSGVSAARGPEIELARYLGTAGRAEIVDAASLADVIQRIGDWDAAPKSLRSRAEAAKREALPRIESDKSRRLLEAADSGHRR